MNRKRNFERNLASGLKVLEEEYMYSFTDASYQEMAKFIVRIYVYRQLWIQVLLSAVKSSRRIFSTFTNSLLLIISYLNYWKQQTLKLKRFRSFSLKFFHFLSSLFPLFFRPFSGRTPGTDQKRAETFSRKRAESFKF